MNFAQLFESISPEEIGERYNPLTLFGKDFYLVTAGREAHYNAMTGSGGGLAVHFKKPAAWCLFQSDRYTLELLEKEQRYTLSFFPDAYKEQVLFLGSKSGRDSEKMRETSLSAMQTPSGDMAFQEARLIIECRLTQITTANPEDFYAQEAKDFLKAAYTDANHYRKYVFGEITYAWAKKASHDACAS